MTGSEKVMENKKEKGTATPSIENPLRPKDFKYVDGCSFFLKNRF
ncbi:MAG: hypothetical protein VW445_12625 [Rhodospirillaceae bacterium]